MTDSIASLKALDLQGLDESTLMAVLDCCDDLRSRVERELNLRHERLGALQGLRVAVGPGIEEAFGWRMYGVYENGSELLTFGEAADEAQARERGADAAAEYADLVKWGKGGKRLALLGYDLVDTFGD